MIEWKRIKPAAVCWVCHAYVVSPTFEVDFDWQPEGWRRVRRGYAGTVRICKDCNDAGRRYTADGFDLPPPSKRDST